MNKCYIMRKYVKIIKFNATGIDIARVQSESLENSLSPRYIYNILTHPVTRVRLCNGNEYEIIVLHVFEILKSRLITLLFTFIQTCSIER